MKLHKWLTVNGQPVELNTDDVRLNLFTPGRAAFTLVSETVVTGVVQFSLGYKPENLHVLFTGFIENSFSVDKKQQQVFCREFTASLRQMLPLNLRNCSLLEVLAAVHDKSGLNFVCAEQEYSQCKAPAFYSIGTGFNCFDALARVYRIPTAIWQQQGNGAVYVGSWEHSYWQGKEIELPVEWQAASGISNSAKVPVVPSIRPGVKFTNGAIVTAVSYGATHMELVWEFNPWGTRWTNKSAIA
jgi:hypothetical protein